MGTIRVVPKKTTKKRPTKHKKRSGLKIAYLAITVILVIVLASFFLGIIIGFKKGISLSSVSHFSKEPSVRDIRSEANIPTGDVKVPILIYHYVEFVKDQRDTVRKSLDIIPPIFENQVKTLKDDGYTFIMSADLGLYLDGLKKLPQKPVILTFDDGYEDFYTDVFPILKRNKVVATAYIISGVIGRLNYMTKDQINQIASSGLVEIGAHSVHHPNLKSLPTNIVEDEVYKSKEMLESQLGIKVVSFAYPYGGFTKETAEIVKRAGYINAVTTKGGSVVNQKNKFTLFRIHPGVAVGEELLSEIKSY